MFETPSANDLLTEVEQCWREESMITARRMAAVAGLLWQRTAEAEVVDDDPGYALITGFARTSAEVGAALNASPKAASTMVSHAEALDIRLPEVASLLADGRIDWSSTETIIRRTELVDAELMPQLDQRLATTISTWQSWSRRRVIDATDAAIARIDPDAAKKRRLTADTERHVTISPKPNGMADIRGSLTAPVAAMFDKRLTDMAATVCGKDPRTLRQRRADALHALGQGRELACGCGRRDCPTRSAAPEPSSRPRFVVNVIAGQDTLTGRSDEPGHLEGYGVIDAELVRQLADEAILRPVHPPTPDVAAALRYQPSAALERWIRSRSLTCSFPGCDRPAWFADIDHTVPFNHARPSAGGPTTPGNLDPKCRQHHRLKTFHSGPGGWHDQQKPDGTIVWTSPTGRVYRSTPDGAELFDDIGAACGTPKPRWRNRCREKAARTAATRHGMHAKRAANEQTLALNRARYHEIDIRKWRNDMRKTLLILKGGKPSTSPWCDWVNDPLEDEHITADWTPPPPSPPTDGDDEPPF